MNLDTSHDHLSTCKVFLKKNRHEIVERVAHTRHPLSIHFDSNPITCLLKIHVLSPGMFAYVRLNGLIGSELFVLVGHGVRASSLSPTFKEVNVSPSLTQEGS